jgi:hypothetical protein
MICSPAHPVTLACVCPAPSAGYGDSVYVLPLPSAVCLFQCKLLADCRIPYMLRASIAFGLDGQSTVAVLPKVETVPGEVVVPLTSFADAWLSRASAKVPAQGSRVKKATSAASAPVKEKKKAPQPGQALEAPAASTMALAPVPPMKAPLVYLPLNEAPSVDSCAGYAVLLDAVDRYASRLNHA